MFLSACATRSITTTPSGLKCEGRFVPEEYASKFARGGDDDTLRWIRPGIDFAEYHKVMVDNAREKGRP